MSVPVASNIAAPISNIASGTHHQGIKASSSVAHSPSFFNPVPIGSVLGGGTTGTGYSETITGRGGTSPYTFATTSGALPGGLSLSSGGTISGTPTATGTFTFTVQVTDANGFSGTQSFSITISSATSTGGGGGNYGFIA